MFHCSSHSDKHYLEWLQSSTHVALRLFITVCINRYVCEIETLHLHLLTCIFIGIVNFGGIGTTGLK